VDALALARFTAACRVGIGAAFLTRPQLWMRPWIGADANRPQAKLLARALGTRDLALGVGTLAALSGDRKALRAWLAGALAADTADLLLTVIERDSLPRQGRVLVAAIAGGGVLMGAGALTQAP
jgi:hypothetical protein